MPQYRFVFYDLGFAYRSFLGYLLDSVANYVPHLLYLEYAVICRYVRICERNGEMKKFVWILALCLGSAWLGASEITKKMRDMEYSINSMQKGFFYNDKIQIAKGLREFKQTYGEFKKHNVFDYLKSSQSMEENIVLNTLKRDEESIQALEEALQKNQILKAAEIHADILHSCTVCHALTRGW